jgi:hypothetical protein
MFTKSPFCFTVRCIDRRRAAKRWPAAGTVGALRNGVLQGSEAARAIVDRPNGGRGTAARFEARRAFARDGHDGIGIRSGRRDADAATATAGRDDTDAGHDGTGRENTARIDVAFIDLAFIDLAFIDLACADARIGSAGDGAVDRVP